MGREIVCSREKRDSEHTKPFASMKYSKGLPVRISAVSLMGARCFDGTGRSSKKKGFKTKTPKTERHSGTQENATETNTKVTNLGGFGGAGSRRIGVGKQVGGPF